MGFKCFLTEGKIPELLIIQCFTQKYQMPSGLNAPTLQQLIKLNVNNMKLV